MSSFAWQQKKSSKILGMLRNIATTARTALNANLAGVRRARTMSTIPVNNVARIVRMKVSGEEDAIKADAIVKTVNQQMQTAGLAGFQKVKRTVCKSEWAYEIEVMILPSFVSPHTVSALLSRPLAASPVSSAVASPVLFRVQVRLFRPQHRARSKSIRELHVRPNRSCFRDWTTSRPTWTGIRRAV